MAKVKQALILLSTMAVALAQRPSFAGFRPIGYPEVTRVPTAELGNRFGEGNSTTNSNSTTSNIPTTTQRLPVEANGDRELIDRLSKLPIDKQPFWFINWQALEANRNSPQTYPQRPSHFAQPLNHAAANDNTNSGTPVRDVDVSALLNNNNGGLPSNADRRPSVNTVIPDDTLGNRFGDATSDPAISTPTTERFSTVYPTGPNIVLSQGQSVASFDKIPFNSNINRRPLSNSGPNPNWTPDSFESPYPILDPKTRNPELWHVNWNSPTNNKQLSRSSPVLANKFRDDDFKEQRPRGDLFVPLGYRRIDQQFYY